MAAFPGKQCSEQTRRALRREFHEWLGRPPGSLILEAERGHLDRILPNLFGYHLVQVGQISDSALLAGSRILNRSVIDLDVGALPSRYPVVCGSPLALPIESDGVDVVLILHVLEFEEEPHKAVHEASRVLAPEGHLIITGFNPWSLLGLWRLFLRAGGAPPWGGHFLAPGRIKDWLALLGFDLLLFDSHFFRPPFGSQRLLHRFAFLERRAAPWLSGFGAVYVVLARKRTTTLIRTRPRWRPRRRPATFGLARRSVRNHPEGRTGG